MKKISDEFHIHYEENRLWEHTHWLGVPIWKNPCDLLILQELIHKVRPEIIVETGTKFGGSALFFASIFELMGSNGKVITIDIDPRVSKEYYGVSSNIRNRIIFKRIPLFQNVLNTYHGRFTAHCIMLFICITYICQN